VTWALTTLRDVADSPLAERLGWTLLHSVWQGAAVAVGLALALILLRRRSAQARYSASCAALACMAMLPALTFLRITGTYRASDAGATDDVPAAPVVSVMWGCRPCRTLPAAMQMKE